MSTSQWGILEPEGETELHKHRLLNVEEKPFKRITKRIAAINAQIQDRTRTPLTPPPEGPVTTTNGTADGDGDNGTDATMGGTGTDGTTLTKTKQKQQATLTYLKNEITLDFTTFDTTITRLQLLMNANTQERTRYTADRHRIIAEANTVRTNTALLRSTLETARATLARRKSFDLLADRIVSSKLLRPRDEQHENLRKLEEECEELERESESYAVTWRERREQFTKIVEEGMQLRRIIRDEKEDLDRREGLEEGQEEEGDSQADGVGENSGNHTQSQSRGGDTPRPGSAGGRSMRGQTPQGGGGGGGGETPRGEGLRPQPGKLGGQVSRGGSRAASREVSPFRGGDEGEIEEGEDIEMEGTGKEPTEGKPRITVNGLEKMDTT